MQDKKTLKLWFDQYKNGVGSGELSLDESGTKLEKLKTLLNVATETYKGLSALGGEFAFFAEKANDLQKKLIDDIQKLVGGLCPEVEHAELFEVKESYKQKYFSLLSKYKTGDPTSNLELKEGIEFFGNLYKNLDTMGEEYSLAAFYLFKVEYTFSGYQEARARK